MSESLDVITRALVACGGRAQVAGAVGVHRTMVDAVARGEKPVPPEWCTVLERITTGGIRAEVLRPDLPWVRVPDENWPVSIGRPLLDLYRLWSSRREPHCGDSGFQHQHNPKGPR